MSTASEPVDSNAVYAPFNPTRIWHGDTYSAITPTLPQLSTAGKSALITGGGSGGIGGAIAKSFASSGISILGLIGRTEASLLKCKQAVQEISPKTKVHIYVVDVIDSAAVQHAVSSFAATTPSGTIDILIANAAHLSELTTIQKTDLKEWWNGFETNVLGNMHLLRAFLPVAAQPKEGGDGKGATIIHISTAAIFMPYIPGYSSYRGSKAAATKLFEYAAGEHPEHFVLQLHPGLILSTGTASRIAESVAGYPSEDVALSADFVNWAVSSEARFLNGRFVFANWDVEDLKALEPELAKDPMRFTTGLRGLA
ncbi:hypothetical protein G7046_g2945 [Stylonectria norvegica]|nr:hypothetical protein G7046_g2945 [Stylonectria norvegica]